jgi:AcrR family transcriptional regulator
VASWGKLHEHTLAKNRSEMSVDAMADTSYTDDHESAMSIRAVPKKSLDPQFSITPSSTVGLPLIAPDDQPRHERSDAAENRRRLLDVAERLFAERGAANVCMHEIARAAGVGQGTLYRRFASKGELCLALLDTQMGDFQNEVLSTLREMSHRGNTRLAQLEWFLGALVQFNERHAPLLCAAQSELRALPLEAVNPHSSPFIWQRMTAIGLLQGAVQTGEARAGLDVPVIADVLLGVMHPPVFQSLRQGSGGYSLERISSGMKQLVSALKR